VQKMIVKDGHDSQNHIIILKNKYITPIFG